VELAAVRGWQRGLERAAHELVSIGERAVVARLETQLQTAVDVGGRRRGQRVDQP